jgi:hypothetical protein
VNAARLACACGRSIGRCLSSECCGARSKFELIQRWVLRTVDKQTVTKTITDHSRNDMPGELSVCCPRPGHVQAARQRARRSGLGCSTTSVHEEGLAAQARLTDHSALIYRRRAVLASLGTAGVWASAAPSSALLLHDRSIPLQRSIDECPDGEMLVVPGTDFRSAMCSAVLSAACPAYGSLPAASEPVIQ